MTTDALLQALESLRTEVQATRAESRMRGEETAHKLEGISKRLDNLDSTDKRLATEVMALGQRMGAFEHRLGRLEEDHTLTKRVSQESDEMQMAALSSAMHIQSRAMEERLTKQDAVLAEQTKLLTKIIKTVGHPVWRGLVWFIGAAISYYLGTKGLK